MRLCVMICWRWFTHHHQSFNQGFRKYDGAPTLIADPPAPVHCADTSEDWSRGSHDKVPPPIDVTFSECSWNNWCIRRFDTYTDTLYLEWVSLKWAEMTVWCLVASTSKSLEQFRESNVTFWIYIMSWRQHWQKKNKYEAQISGPSRPSTIRLWRVGVVLKNTSKSKATQKTMPGKPIYKCKGSRFKTHLSHSQTAYWLNAPQEPQHVQSIL